MACRATAASSSVGYSFTSSRPLLPIRPQLRTSLVRSEQVALDQQRVEAGDALRSVSPVQIDSVLDGGARVGHGRRWLKDRLERAGGGRPRASPRRSRETQTGVTGLPDHPAPAAAVVEAAAPTSLWMVRVPAPMT
jgi:hypothetical protein